MSIMISGICGFVGSALARCLHERDPQLQIFGFDNFSRPGSHLNRAELERLGIRVLQADARQVSDIEHLPGADWVIDAAANPSVLAGYDGLSSPRQVIENNLYGTVNLLEYARRHRAGFVLLSTSRVYSIEPLSKLPLTESNDAFILDAKAKLPAGISEQGIDERFSVEAPISLYGATKLSSEALALEYSSMFDMKVWINRCGVLAGAGQFGRPDQGIFSYWINSYRARKPLRYLGFGGSGYQVRDCLHPNDLATLIIRQMKNSDKGKPKICNLGGGSRNSMSLLQLSKWCAEAFGSHEVVRTNEDRPLDLPWVVMDSSLARSVWNFEVSLTLPQILSEIAEHAARNPDWLKVSAV